MNDLQSISSETSSSSDVSPQSNSVKYFRSWQDLKEHRAYQKHFGEEDWRSRAGIHEAKPSEADDSDFVTFALIPSHDTVIALDSHRSKLLSATVQSIKGAVKRQDGSLALFQASLTDLQSEGMTYVTWTQKKKGSRQQRSSMDSAASILEEAMSMAGGSAILEGLVDVSKSRHRSRAQGSNTVIDSIAEDPNEE